MKESKYVKEEGKKITLDLDEAIKDIAKNELKEKSEVILLKDDSRGLVCEMLSHELNVKELSKLALKNFDSLLSKRGGKNPPESYG